MNKKKLIREQLDASLQRFSPLLEITTPSKGWIRAIRDALGMTARQLSERLGVTQQSVARIEKEETTGSVTIKTMNRIADSLDCVFVYGFVPRTSLVDTISRQAKELAIRRLSKASQTMSLENQALSREENQKVVSEMVDELIRRLPSDFWNKL
jgi:predicted DNA-binding mobile mystery protein A